MPIEKRIKSLLDQIDALDDELEALFHEREAQLRYHVRGRRIAFEKSVREAHRRLRTGSFTWLLHSQLRNVLSAPFIYALIVPFGLLDLSITLYQAVCFRLYRIRPVPRADFIVIDRHRLAYLNVIEKLNCVYCGYANGLLAYTREVGARTEQYWCPIKHARKVAARHSKYAAFNDYGDPEKYAGSLQRFREELRSRTPPEDGDAEQAGR